MRILSFLTLLTLACASIPGFAQQPGSSFDTQWKTIDSLIEKNGQPKTALAKVTALYTRAKKEGNDVQAIKALIYRLNLTEQLTDDDRSAAFDDLHKNINAANGPERSILQSILASAYWNFLQRNRYRIYDRTQTVNFVKNDPATWSAVELNQKISDLFLASVDNYAVLSKTLLKRYDPIIIRGNTRNLRPTLFDLLAHQALNYFKNDERNASRPSYAFEISDSMAFSPAKIFIARHFVARDTVSVEYKALTLYQKLLTLHLGDPNPGALIDADIERISYVHDHSTAENKENSYKTAIQKIISDYPKNANTSQAIFLLAQWYTTQAQRYDPIKDTANRFAYLKAEELCKQALENPDSSEGRASCSNLMQTILQKEVGIHAEKVNIPGDPFRMLFSYRNMAAVYYRIIRIDPIANQRFVENTWDSAYWVSLKKMPSIRNVSVSIPDTKDHQMHRVELKIDALPAGEYALLASADSSFSLRRNTLALQYFYISSISFIMNGPEVYVVNRSTGAPVEGATIQLWYRNYNAHSQLVKSGQFKTDKQGYVKLQQPFKTESNSFVLDISAGKDRLFMERNQSVYYFPYQGGRSSNDDEDDDGSTFLFTDRAIYRPGQIVYFKGIVIRKKGQQSMIVPGMKTRIYLKDANSQEVDSLDLTTNDFGSYSGKFTLPRGTLNGTFTLEDDETTNDISFRVEEYKRPKFSVDLKKPGGIYRLSDTVKIEGSAKAYAGNDVGGATVSYRVVRRAIFPMYMEYIRIWPPNRGAQVEITNGTTITNANGKFVIPFAAIPDKSIPASQQPTFSYEVTAEVTDLNGETRSGSAGVIVGYGTTNVSVRVPKHFSADSLNKIGIATTNMSGVSVSSKVALTVKKLRTPQRLLRERYWDQPDQFVMSRPDYENWFPNDPYSDENEIAKWPVEKTVFEKSLVTSSDSNTTTANVRGFAPGTYVVEASMRDSFNTVVTDRAYVEIFANGGQQSAGLANASIQAATNAQLTKNVIDYRVQTNLGDIYLLQELKGKAGNERTVIPPSSTPFHNQITLARGDEAGVQVNLFFVRNNRMYVSTEIFAFTDSLRQLKIEYSSFRDKMLPGEPEKWKVKISGYQKDKAAAELLTSMYDASLDQFDPHAWTAPAIGAVGIEGSNWNGSLNFGDDQGVVRSFENEPGEFVAKSYDQLRTIAAPSGNLARSLAGRAPGIMIRGASDASLQDVVVTGYGVKKEAAPKAAAIASARPRQNERETSDTTADGKSGAPAIQPRTNLNETAFFFPDLHTDSAGNIEFSFAAPEALSSWKWMLLAHTKDLRFTYDEKIAVTQKELMVQPNIPRFIRQGDSIALPAKLVNLSTNTLSGKVMLELTDAMTGENVDGLFGNSKKGKSFTISAGQSSAVQFIIHVPTNFVNPLTYKIIATSGNTGDGEQSVLPVLSNRMLVTESLPLFLRGTNEKSFSFEKLLNSGSSKTLQQHALTVEFTSNPVWYAVQSLPYLAEGDKENAEAVFNRFYANAVASMIANHSPRLKAIFDKWSTTDTTALMSNLEKNEDLKSVLLAETPWVMDAKTEAQQKQNIGKLFKLYAMSYSQDNALRKLQDLQLSSGGFAWCAGGREDRYMTQYILTGIGRLKKLGALAGANKEIDRLLRSALTYLDGELKNDYAQLKKFSKKLPEGDIDNITAQYLYMRSFFADQPVGGDVFTAYNYYRKQSMKGWLRHNSFTRATIALALARTGDPQTANKIMTSLKETAIHNDNLGMYWKDMSGGYYWYESPIESQAALIEAFSEIQPDQKLIAELKTWLLTNKQTNNWKSTRATADACYALLLQGSDWTSQNTKAEITLGETRLTDGGVAEAATGYFRRQIPGDSITPSMGKVRVELKNTSGNSSPSWGAVYWQYFEDLDKISTAKTPLQLDKKLFIEKNTDRGPVLVPLANNNTVQVGDKIRVRIELRCDRPMEYVHMKDMRASCLEPVNVLSGYQYQDGLGYYQSTKDASTDFFFGLLPKGVFVFEYSLFVSAAGNFSNGVTTIQCMYAPEFGSHSEGIKLRSELK